MNSKQLSLKLSLSKTQTQSFLAMEYGSITTTDYLDDLFSSQNTEVDVGMEWLSVFVEDCFSSRGNCLPAPAAGKPTADAAAKPSQQPIESLSALNSLQKFAVAGKARSKRKRVAAAESGRAAASTWFLPSSDPPLLDQAYWMADSELLGPKKGPQQERQRRSPEQEQDDDNEDEDRREGEEKVSGKGKLVILAKSKVVGVSEGAAARRCSHCLSQRTPQWRAGPMGPKTLCNACGVRYKSGRLLPEYRPAKSPTFVSCLHSNSHRKVLEMRGSGTEVAGNGGVSTTAGDGGLSTTAVVAAENV